MLCAYSQILPERHNLGWSRFVLHIMYLAPYVIDRCNTKAPNWRYKHENSIGIKRSFPKFSELIHAYCRISILLTASIKARWIISSNKSVHRNLVTMIARSLARNLGQGGTHWVVWKVAEHDSVPIIGTNRKFHSINETCDWVGSHCIRC